jgi:hypothetical protein
VPRTKNKSLRSQLLTCVAKVCAYREVGKEIEAKQWAAALQSLLIQHGLLIDIPKRALHNGEQSHNGNKTKKETTG